MAIIYLLSVALLLSTFIIVKKTDNKINIISFISISIVTLFCYNAFICYVLTFFKIPIKLWVLLLINLVISILLIFSICKRKEVQKYKFEKIHFLYITLILLVVLIISYINFGNPFNIKYETSDPSVHYLTSVMFAESDSLFITGKNIDPIYGDMGVRKIVSYVNSGILMKCFSSSLEPIQCYNIFVIFGIITLFLIGTITYSSFTNFAKRKEHFLWAFLVALICMLGYPLNSFLFGFEYMSMGLLILCAIIDLVMYYYEKDILNKKYFIVLMTLLNLGLFLSYYMFVPFVYLALGIYFYTNIYSKTKKIISMEIISMWVITLVIPFILGFMYNIAPTIYIKLMNNNLAFLKFILIIFICFGIFLCLKKNKYIKKIKLNKKIISLMVISLIILVLLLIYILVIKFDIYNSMLIQSEKFFKYAKRILHTLFKNDGYIYINIYSNMLLFLPLTVYFVFKESKKSDKKFIFLLLDFCLLFIFILLMGYRKENVSIYYLLKNHFALWIILIYCNYLALIKLSERNVILPRLFLSLYILLMISCTFFSDVKLIDDYLENKNEKIYSVMEIFGANKTMLFKEKEKLNQDEIGILMYARKNLNYDSKIEVVSDGIQYYWSYVLLRYCNYEEALNERIYGQYKLNIKVDNLFDKINNVDYMIYFNRSEKFKELEEELFLNSEIIYENDAGGILKYNN